MNGVDEVQPMGVVQVRGLFIYHEFHIHHQDDRMNGQMLSVLTVLLLLSGTLVSAPPVSAQAVSAGTETEPSSVGGGR